MKWVKQRTSICFLLLKQTNICSRSQMQIERTITNLKLEKSEQMRFKLLLKSGCLPYVLWRAVPQFWSRQTKSINFMFLFLCGTEINRSNFTETEEASPFQKKKKKKGWIRRCCIWNRKPVNCSNMFILQGELLLLHSVQTNL